MKNPLPATDEVVSQDEKCLSPAPSAAVRAMMQRETMNVGREV